ncbi:MAG: trypsin-like peptidase domain-containing protein [Nitrospinota bacterium]
MAKVFFTALIAFTELCFFTVSPASGAEPVETGRLKLFEQLQQTIITVSEEIKPKVVHIEAFIRVHQKRNKSLGSGVLCDENGYIMTNHHVIFRAERINVIFPLDKKKYSAEIVASDPLTDIAVLKINLDAPMQVPAFGDSDKVKVGEWVLAIGNPFGLDGTVSLGIVSAKARNLDVVQINEFIQTDAMIDPGSSGGPLVNIRGEVVGINSRIQGRGIGFTIPINTALKIKNSIIRKGNFERGWLGISMTPFPKELAEHVDIPFGGGIFVSKVMEETPADRAGIKRGDIIVEFDSKLVGADYDHEIKIFQRTITNTKVGETVPVKVIRGQETLTLHVTIARYPKVTSNEIETEYGFNIMEITNHLYNASNLERRDGVLISFVSKGSPASEAKLRQGDIIIFLGGREISTVDEFQEALESVRGKRKFLVKTVRGKNLFVHLLKTGNTNEKELPEH